MYKILITLIMFSLISCTSKGNTCPMSDDYKVYTPDNQKWHMYKDTWTASISFDRMKFRADIQKISYFSSLYACQNKSNYRTILNTYAKIKAIYLECAKNKKLDSPDTLAPGSRWLAESRVTILLNVQYVLNKQKTK